MCERESRKKWFHEVSPLSCEWPALLACAEELLARTRSQPAAAKAAPVTVDINAVTWPGQINKSVHKVCIDYENITTVGSRRKTGGEKMKHKRN